MLLVVLFRSFNVCLQSTRSCHRRCFETDSCCHSSLHKGGPGAVGKYIDILAEASSLYGLSFCSRLRQHVFVHVHPTNTATTCAICIFSPRLPSSSCTANCLMRTKQTVHMAETDTAPTYKCRPPLPASHGWASCATAAAAMQRATTTNGSRGPAAERTQLMGPIHCCRHASLRCLLPRSQPTSLQLLSLPRGPSLLL